MDCDRQKKGNTFLVHSAKAFISLFGVCRLQRPVGIPRGLDGKRKQRANMCCCEQNRCPEIIPGLSGACSGQRLTRQHCPLAALAFDLRVRRVVRRFCKQRKQGSGLCVLVVPPAPLPPRDPDRTQPRAPVNLHRPHLFQPSSVIHSRAVMLLHFSSLTFGAEQLHLIPSSGNIFLCHMSFLVCFTRFSAQPSARVK